MSTGSPSSLPCSDFLLSEGAEIAGSKSQSQENNIFSLNCNAPTLKHVYVRTDKIGKVKTRDLFIFE